MLTFFSLIISIVVVGWLVLFFRNAAEGRVHTLDELATPIEDLLKRGFDNGFLIIDQGDKGNFIQFRKYIRSKRNYGIEFAFPNAPWSSTYFAAVKQYCMLNEFQVTISKEQQCDSSMEYLYADCGQDIVKAHELTVHVFSNIFHSPPDGAFFVALENASPLDELIDTPRSRN